jgi:Galactose oxidase, central domain
MHSLKPTLAALLCAAYPCNAWTRCGRAHAAWRSYLTAGRSKQHINPQDAWEWSKLEVEEAAPQPTSRDFAGMVDLPDGRLLLFGGLDAGEKRLEDTWIFDPAKCARWLF